jgi:subtilisin
MRVRRSAAWAASGQVHAAGWWRRHTHLVSNVLVHVALIAGMLPSWSMAGAMSAHALPAAQSRKDAVIVEVARGANPGAVARALGVVPTHVYSEVFLGFAAELPATAARAADRQRGVVRIWPDLPVHAFAQTVPTGVDRVDADQNPWADIKKDGRSIDADVAVLDTGIAKHRELTIKGGKACVGSGYSDGDGHGTHVAGIIAAKDNTIGVVGVAPGAQLWAVKVLDSNGNGSWSSVICGLDWVYAHRDTIDVVNMSLGSDAIAEDQNPCGSTTTPLHNAVCRVVTGGVPVIVAAGNEAKNAATAVPATYEEAITVSAFTDFDGEPGGEGVSTCTGDSDDTFTPFSNYGPDVDIAAPGVCIRSTWRNGKYKSISGTSMATPHVTGAAALYVAKNPNATVADVRAWLEGPASRPNSSPHGFTGDPDAFDEGVLALGPP